MGLRQDELDELFEKAFMVVDGLWFLGIEDPQPCVPKADADG